MKSKSPGGWGIVFAAFIGAMGTVVAGRVGQPIRHRLVEGSTFTDDCPPCARPTIVLRMRGTFDVTETWTSGATQALGLRNIEWTTGGIAGGEVRVTGSGWVMVHAGTRQEWTLDLKVGTGAGAVARRFTNTTATLSRALPNLSADLDSVEQTPVQVYRLAVRSAPLRDLWFVTSHGFTRGNGGMAGGAWRPPGDVLSMGGHVVVENQRLTARLGVMPIVPPLPVGALDVMPGGKLVFSLREPIFSETLGQLGQGMLLGSDGMVFRTIEALLGPLGPMAGQTDGLGMDAAQVLGSDEVLFSVTRDVETRTGTVSHGDMVSSLGRVHRRGKELIAAFQPLPTAGCQLSEVGLDAWHEWPHGEAWFSVRQGFDSATWGPVRAGDVLSDRGWIVFRNLELMDAFKPLEDLADFGLEGLYVVTDEWDEPGAVSARWTRAANGMDVGGEGAARAWQLEATPFLGGPFAPVSPITPFATWTVPASGHCGWCRLRAW